MISEASIKISVNFKKSIDYSYVRTCSDGSAIVSLIVIRDVDISFDIITTAERYAKEKDSFTVHVNTLEKVSNEIDLELSEWIIHIVIGKILMIGVVMFMFLRRSKSNLEEE